MSTIVAEQSVPKRARVVVIGGGIGGCSILYWLARLGLRDAVLVERSQLTSGSTFHSAGLVGQLRADPTLTRMNMYSVELYRRLQQGEQPLQHCAPLLRSNWGSILCNSAITVREIRLADSTFLRFKLPLDFAP